MITTQKAISASYEIANEIKKLLGSNVVGVYLFGSLTLAILMKTTVTWIYQLF